MADKILNTILILRHDGQSAWATSDVKLQKGELALCYNDDGTITAKVGVGDQGSTWADSILLDKAVRDALAAEVDRAGKAEAALSDRIGALDEAVKAIDYVDNDELAAAIADFATVDYVEGEVSKLEQAIGGIVHFTTKVVSTTDEVTETGILYLIKDESVAGVDKYNEYLFIDGQAVLIGDTTTDLSNYYTKEEVDAELKELTDAVALKLDAATFEEFEGTNTQAIATAKGEAIEDAVAQVEEKGYAVAVDVAAELAKKIETATIAHTSDTVAEGVTVDGTKLNIVVDAYTKQEVRDYVADVIEDMTGGESAADVKLLLENHIETYTEKVGQIDAKDQAQDELLEQHTGSIADLGDEIDALAKDVYTKTEADAEFMTEGEVDARINALIVAADPEDGKTISNIQALVQYVDENAGEIAELISDVDKAKEDISKNAEDIAAVLATVGGHTTSIAKNAEDIAAINEAIQGIVQPKASDEVTVAEDGTLGLGEVSTDKLVMGTQTLIIHGGTATN